MSSEYPSNNSFDQNILPTEKRICATLADSKYFYRRGESTGSYKRRSEEVGKNFDLDSRTTAVVRFMFEPTQFLNVDEIYQTACSFWEPEKYAKQYGVVLKNSDLCADHRKIYWCYVTNKWKMAAFYLDTSLDKAMIHAFNRVLFEPWLGTGYYVTGCDDGASFAKNNAVLKDCIEICQASLTNMEENTGYAFHDAQAIRTLNKHLSRIIV